ncbi:MAG TPA: FlgD immunoglobulin-like domain containing protein [bacterium]|nr:FlgD immunoglobulin-like domain containing protein [bacterium]
MTNLVEEFFKRDLTEAEADGLEKLLENSPEDALRFGQNLEQQYLSLGLTVPQIPSHFGPELPKAGWGFLKSLLAAVTLTGAGLLTWHLWPKPQEVITLPAQKAVLPHTLSWPKAKLPPPPVEIPQRLTGASQEGNRLSVVVELDHAAPIQVCIYNPANQRVRDLYQGNLQPGKWSIHWDGLLTDGSKAPSGNYRIQVQSGTTEMSKNVVIESGK